METPPSAEPAPVTSITVYWRPGCPFCSRLRASLKRTDLSVNLVNIWDSPDAAAFVRSVAGGNETVPTVTVGGVSLVNPSVRAILAAANHGSASGSPSTARARLQRRISGILGRNPG